MSEDKKQCFRCRFFDYYYIKKIKRFDKTKFGWCGNGGKLVENKDCCDGFVLKKPTHTPDILLKGYLSDLLTEISELRKAVEAEIQENEEL